MPTTTLTHIGQLPEPLWPRPDSQPFLQQPYLDALETCGAVSAATGWQPCHLLLDEPAACLPMYRKSHSRGEYVFDQSWAEAYHRHGLAYYPKLLTAIPFTPVSGPRLLSPHGDTPTPVLFQHIKEQVAEQAASSWHGLFLPEGWLAPAEEAGLALRCGCRFLWHDRDYGNIDNFLGRFTSKRRKTLRRERSKVAEAGIRCQRLEGRNTDSRQQAFFYQCYAATYLVRGQRPYLPFSFFESLFLNMPDNLMLVLAENKEGPLAAALFFHDRETLYGRYWGAVADVDSLHFEVCYYQGIEYCLERGLQHFDPGTQGEHKLMRGFEPELTWSAHWLAEPAFMHAVHEFVTEETRHVERYRQEALTLLPFRNDNP